jgi:DNA-binding NtrC family response regulator
MILIIDDDPGIRELLGDFLEDFPGALHYAESVPQALGLLQKNHFQVVICDLVLGNGHGDNIFNYMRKKGSVHERTPVLFISGHKDGPALQDDLSSFLGKPFSQEKFLEELDLLLAKTSQPKSSLDKEQGPPSNKLHPHLKKLLQGKK